MSRLARIVRRSRGYAALAGYRAQRSEVGDGQGWWLWPFSVCLFLYGLGGLGWCVYKGWLGGSLFTAFWLAALTYMSWPSRRAWRLHRASARARQGRG